MAEPDDVVMRLPVLSESVSIARRRVRRFVRLAPEADSILELLVTEMVGIAVRALPPSPEQLLEVRVSRGPDLVRATVRAEGIWCGTVRDDEDGLSQTILSRLADASGSTDNGLWVEVHAHVARVA